MTKFLSPAATTTLDSYLHFRLGSAVASVPYFNNKTVRARAALRAFIGKGTATEIYDEALALAIRGHVDTNALADESLKKLLTDQNLGIDCSAFAYYVLDAESVARGTGLLRSHMKLVNATGPIGRIRALFRPVENCDVQTFAADANSHVIPVSYIKPGDIITMTNDGEESERDHILVVTEVEYGDDRPKRITYAHAAAYPEDGVYGTGVKQGTMDVSDPSAALVDALWRESGTTEHATRIWNRARNSRTELRRLNWF